MSKDLNPYFSSQFMGADSWVLFAFTSILYSATLFCIVFIFSSLWDTALTKSLLLLDSQQPSAVTQFLSAHPAVHASYFYEHAEGLLSSQELSSLSRLRESYELELLPHAFVVYARSAQMNVLQEDLSQQFSLALHYLPTTISSQKIDLSFTLVLTSLWVGALSLTLQYLLTHQLLQQRMQTFILAMLYGASKQRLAVALAKRIGYCAAYTLGTTLLITALSYFYSQAFMLLPFFPITLWACAFFTLVSIQLSYCLYLTYWFFIDTIKQVHYY